LHIQNALVAMKGTDIIDLVRAILAPTDEAFE